MKANRKEGLLHLHPDLHSQISDERDRDTARRTETSPEAPEPVTVGEEVVALREQREEEKRAA